MISELSEIVNVKDFKIGLIYKYTSPNGKMYIGQTVDERSRKSQHKIKTSVSQTHFGSAIRKYGFENFQYEVLIKFKPTSDLIKLKRVLDKLEIRYIKLFSSYNREFGYNLTRGGDGCLGLIVSEETKEKLRNNMLNMSDEYREKLSISGKKKCEDGVPDYMLDNLEKGRGLKSEETKIKMSNSRNDKKIVEKYDLEDNLLDEFNSIQDAAKSILDGVQKTKSNKIGECCNGKRKSIYGYVWKFKC